MPFVSEEAPSLLPPLSCAPHVQANVNSPRLCRPSARVVQGAGLVLVSSMLGSPAFLCADSSKDTGPQPQN